MFWHNSAMVIGKPFEKYKSKLLHFDNLEKELMKFLIT